MLPSYARIQTLGAMMREVREVTSSLTDNAEAETYQGLLQAWAQSRDPLEDHAQNARVEQAIADLYVRVVRPRWAVYSPVDLLAVG